MLVLLIVFFGLIILGCPIGYGLGMTGALYFVLVHPELITLVPERLFSGMNSSLLISLPLFTLMGLLMNESHLTRKMIDLLMMAIGRIRGALGVVDVLVSMLFGGISGSSVSDTAAIGSILIPEMRDKGYSKEFATGLTVAANTMGMIIPPSIPMLIFAAVASQSVGKCFMGGLIPGALIAIFMIGITIFYAKAEKIPLVKVSFTKDYVLTTLKEGILAIIMPLFVMGSIIAGICTSTEAAAVGVLYALVVGLFVYKSLKWKAILRVLKETVHMSASIMIIIAFANMFTWIMTLENIPQKTLLLVTSLHLSPVSLMLAMAVIILIAGMFLDVTPIIMLLTPVFLPAVSAVGINPIQFGALLIVGTAIGLTTPPVGMCLNVASTVSKMNIVQIFRAALPFLAADLVTILLICSVPGVSTWLPSLIK
jgi:tripartite ATP-independent transporter DctM subunit